MASNASGTNVSAPASSYDTGKSSQPNAAMQAALAAAARAVYRIHGFTAAGVSPCVINRAATAASRITG